MVGHLLRSTSVRFLAPPSRFNPIRAMSSSPDLHKFVVYAPDCTDPDAFARRMSVRATHLANAKKYHDEGFMRAYSLYLTSLWLASVMLELFEIPSSLVIPPNSIHTRTVSFIFINIFTLF